METAKAVPLSIICMAWESNMTRDQKEQYVLELYQQGRTIRHIAQLVHMSFTEIGRIIKRYKEEIERSGQMEEKGDDDYDVKSKSKTAKAIKLFSEDKNLVDVVIALDLQPDEVRAIYREFLQLKDIRELVEVYDEMQNYLPSLLELFRLTVSRGLNANDVMDILRIINTGEFEYTQRRIQSRMDALTWVNNEIKKKEYHLRTVNNRIREFSYIEGDIIPMTNSANEPTYRPDNTYSSLPDDTSIKPIPYMWDDMKQ
jgi:DNA-binding Lrp family transcriptional regulator